ncbi:dipeptidase PepV [Streptococcus suis]|uniref:dipeptidase PepV n=1 Tax=Streptococcus suis TaxID=1307 RepID=UPI0011464FFB|nr:dipeptidase PepV [Streptococcus suis]MCH1638244.1 dipeptidase PepV [Streptococcus suis]MCH1649073.1 dipeptidase PepV [Streptococcus suis]NQK41899.1 dipeptidase PepV [Streptococcus suis]NQO42010.1 dipeptidase PepV [Streptococcus suis]TQE45243.1 dipeptidase PepV [Streptococcus suis]
MNWLNEIKKYEEELLQDICDLVSINSVRDDSQASEECPVGPGPKRALYAVETLLNETGLKTEIIDNLVVQADWGSSDEVIGIMGHVDVVAVGEGWLSDPFVPTLREGRLYGRGVLDDKGPLVCAIFAIKILQRLGIHPKKTVRFIIGSDEESEWKCMKAYQKYRSFPKVGWVPDAYFPVIHGEKGTSILQITTGSVNRPDFYLKEFHAGVQVNMVPDKAVAVLEAEEPEKISQAFYRFINDYSGIAGEVCRQEKNVTLTLFGQSAHGSKPFLGENAATYLARFLDAYSRVSTNQQDFLSLLADCHEDSFGESFGIAYQDPEMGKLTVNVGQVSYTEEAGGLISCDCRYPKGIEFSRIQTLVASKLGECFQVAGYEKLSPHFVSPSSELVQCLQEVYRDQTGGQEAPLVIGGATYARLMEEGVAFGALFPDREDTMHQANEYMEVEDLLRIVAIYSETIYNLACSC